jgi:hypothetical protein
MNVVVRLQRRVVSVLSRRRLRASTLLVAGILVGSGTGIVVAGPVLAGPPPPPSPPPGSHRTLFVSPSGSPSNPDTSCSTAAYSSIDAALQAASSGDTVHVCPGTYDEQVSISTSQVTLTGSGASSVIEPSSMTVPLPTDLDTNAPLVAIIDVTPGTKGVRIEHLALDGSLLSASSAVSGNGCGNPDFVGVAFQAASGTASDLSVANVELPPDDFYCASNPVVGVFVQSGPSGSADVTISHDAITSYKAAIGCEDSGTRCTITGNVITGTADLPVHGPGYNGVEVLTGAAARIDANTISENDYTGGTNPYEPQADFAAGVLLYGASGTTTVRGNTLTDDQIGVMLVHTDATVEDNAMTQSGSGIENSVGVFTVGCDVYCRYFGLSGGNEHDTIVGNSISFPGTLSSPVPGTTGIWAGDGAVATAPPSQGYSNDPGTVRVEVDGNRISGAVNAVVLGPAATGEVSVPPTAPGPPPPPAPGPPPPHPPGKH